jgi:hypothetical protein
MEPGWSVSEAWEQVNSIYLWLPHNKDTSEYTNPPALIFRDISVKKERYFGISLPANRT